MCTQCMTHIIGCVVLPVLKSHAVRERGHGVLLFSTSRKTLKSVFILMRLFETILQRWAYHYPGEGFKEGMLLSRLRGTCPQRLAWLLRSNVSRLTIYIVTVYVGQIAASTSHNITCYASASALYVTAVGTSCGITT